MSVSEGLLLIDQAGSLTWGDIGPMRPGDGEAIVEVAGCGLCHTDVGFALDGIPTRHPLPLVLGHEISGHVVDTGAGAEDWKGKSVVVPAVIPCGECVACLSNRPTVCQRQFMPGNDGNGGFASHVRVPARSLCPVPETLPDGITLEMLSVIADAVSTPYEAIERSGLGAEDVAIFVGAGGIGGFGIQIAAARGATVVAVDIDQDRLDLAASHGATLTLNAGELDLKAMKIEVRKLIKASGKGRLGSRIFETSGTPAGQETAFSLLDFGGYLAVVGFTPRKVEIRLSNLMAFDATARGNWGCAPEHYPAALSLVLEGKVALEPYVERHDLAELPELIKLAASHELRRRAILVPRNHRK